MNCLDTNVLIDYLQGEPAVGAYLEARSDDSFFTPTVALHETFIGVVRQRGPDALERTQTALDWLEPIELTVGGAAEAARVDAELHANGEPIGPMDTLIAGIARDTGATVITRDDHFTRVSDLDVVLVEDSTQ